MNPHHLKPYIVALCLCVQKNVLKTVMLNVNAKPKIV